jgi:hypothetical protein
MALTGSFAGFHLRPRQLHLQDGPGAWTALGELG